MSESTLPTSVISGFTQFVADNVDHNVRSLDGRGTCQGMGITCFMGVFTNNILERIIEYRNRSFVVRVGKKWVVWASYDLQRKLFPWAEQLIACQ